MKKISKLTNSEIGSNHWLNTLLGRFLHIGEYIRDRDIAGSDNIRAWGTSLMEGSREIIDWFEINPPERLEELERSLLKKLKEKYEELDNG